MTLTKTLIQRIQSAYSRGVQSDDTRLSSRHIYNVLLTMRSTLIENKLNKRQPLSQWNFQTLPCVELVEALPYECPCLPAIGCKILRSKYPLPKPLTALLGGHMLQSVTSLEGSIMYDPTTWKDKKRKAGNKYTSKKPDYYIRNNYLYITSSTGPTAITVTGLFEDPLEAMAYPGSCGGSQIDPCASPLDSEFPIDKSMVKTLVEMAYQELLGGFSRGAEDTSNNSNGEDKQRER